MYAPRYWSSRYWTGRYWPPGGVVVPTHVHVVPLVSDRPTFPVEWADPVQPVLVGSRGLGPEVAASAIAIVGVSTTASTSGSQGVGLTTAEGRSTVGVKVSHVGPTSAVHGGGELTVDDKPADLEVSDD